MPIDAPSGQEREQSRASPVISDVTVIGGGLAGLAASLHLAKAGLRVVCIEPQTGDRQPVGESLDWSTPGLLAGLELPMAELMASGLATYKRGVTLQLKEGGSQKYFPKPWLGRFPFHVELRTLHVDRALLDRRLYGMALALGVNLVEDRAVGVERDGNRVASVHTAAGGRFRSPWFVDASGYAASLLAREFRLPAVEYGPRKVAIWTYFATPVSQEGTTIYAQSAGAASLEWVWEIPISPEVSSVGFVSTAAGIKNKRKEGVAVDEILRSQLSQFPRFAALLEQGWDRPPKVVTFACRTYTTAAGPNWILIGEAASLVDPITSNGATAALRHAREATALIIASRGRSELPLAERESYSHRVVQMAAFFNSGIDQLVYDWPVRLGIGLKRAARIYTIGAWSMNAIYSRLKLRGRVSNGLLGFVLRSLRAGAWMGHGLFRLVGRPPKGAGP